MDCEPLESLDFYEYKSINMTKYFVITFIDKVEPKTSVVCCALMPVSITDK